MLLYAGAQKAVGLYSLACARPRFVAFPAFCSGYIQFLYHHLVEAQKIFPSLLFEYLPLES